MAPPISPTMTTARVRSSASSASRASRVVVPMMGSPPMPMKADSPCPACTRFKQMRVPRLPLREITPMSPGRKMLSLNAGMNPAKHSPGVTRPAVFGPSTRVPLARAADRKYMTSCTGMCSVRMTSFLTPASMASSAASRTASGGMKSTDTSMSPWAAASRALA